VAATIAVTLRRLWPLTGDKALVALALIALGASTWAVGMQLGRRRGLVRNAGSAATATSTFRLLTIGTVILAVAGFVVGLVVPL
jgi:hypothetical protein